MNLSAGAKTTEAVYIFVLLILSVVGDRLGVTPHEFMWLSIVGVGYMLSRALAKYGAG